MNRKRAGPRILRIDAYPIGLPCTDPGPGRVGARVPWLGVMGGANDLAGPASITLINIDAYCFNCFLFFLAVHERASFSTEVFSIAAEVEEVGGSAEAELP